MTSEARLELLILRATLRNAGVARGAPELAAFDEHALWMLERLGDAANDNTDRPRVEPLGSYEKARALCLRISLRVVRTVAGRPQVERDEVYERAHAFEDLTRAMLYATTRRRGSAPMAATTATTATRSR